MDFTLNDDQGAVVDAIDKLARQFDTKPTDFDGFALYSAELEHELAESGYFDIATFPEMGPLTAALAVERLARSPFTCEAALSMLLRHHLGEDLPRPVAIVEDGRPGRFVAGAKSVLVIDGERMRLVHPEASDTRIVESIYAYPMGELVADLPGRELSTGEAENVRTWLRVACAAEIAGLMQASLDATIEHLGVRKQFGRPLGTFQALRHRMAECAVLVGGVRRLALRAAWSGDAGDAALAAMHAQDSANRLNYDVHQMMGAMGMTLEMPLHLWTYRTKALLSELGGRTVQGQAVAQHCFKGAN